MSDRINLLNNQSVTDSKLVIYWMSRDQRVWDNHALLAAAQLAAESNRKLRVLFCLDEKFPGANLRSFDFMLRGLEQVAQGLSELGIRIELLRGEPSVEVVRYLKANDCAALFSDFDPLRVKRQWKEEVNREIHVAHFEVDAHNIVPCRVASQKQEYGAYTLRPKINRLLPFYLNDLSELLVQEELLKRVGEGSAAKVFSANALLDEMQLARTVSALSLPSGEEAAREAIQHFISGRLAGYDEQRNLPELDHQSDLSPYLHFGQLSAQRLTQEVQQADVPENDRAAFLEQVIVRRELSDNFCYYNTSYDRWEGAPDWAKETLLSHAADEREYLYELSQFENAETHDPLWNAAQVQLLRSGKIHGYMRMYWAKKILEWTPSPQEALQIAIYLNDKYAIDGRDPNGYVGCQWAICGLHDRPWTTRPVFGKIRFMNDKGCKRKFDVERYIGMWGR
ncbi:deoxyribodipyrimidine photo-lyase [Parabacteroides sp. FAFU027]|uniref:deoxyribodipyrimidine photo-lyase n=1 Tax=Parabacteroides sp. FAFU027 TaxID=2922715 RepID=UPI001FB044A1|nr:deoxyribodipyrimidine photo-lyase [Parabacteroides sp. FAFU027]